MNNTKLKYNLPVITSEVYDLDTNRYELRKGNIKGAPLCPYGNHFKWVGFDKKTMRYIRVTTSVFKRLIITMDKKEIALHEAQHTK